MASSVPGSERQALRHWQHWRELSALCLCVSPGWHRQAVRQRIALAWQIARNRDLHEDLQAFFSQPVLQEVARRHPRQLAKIYRDYLCLGLSLSERVERLCAHHVMTRQLLGPTLWAQVMLTDDTPLCRVALPGAQGLMKIRLIHAHHYEREGELSLVLDDPFGTPLYALTFSLERLSSADGGGIGVLIGAVQGQLSLEVARHVTKLCLGLRPPNLLLFALQILARELGVSHLRGVGQNRHVYHGSHIEHDSMHFDYDAFWEAVGGVELSSGWFELPLTQQRRLPADMPANKRAQYQRRYAWLDQLDADLSRWLDAQRRAEQGDSAQSVFNSSINAVHNAQAA